MAAIIEKLRGAALDGLVVVGEAGEPICEVPLGPGNAGMILYSGLNPAATAAEVNIEVVTHAMSGVIDYGRLKGFWKLGAMSSEGTDFVPSAHINR